MLQITRSTLWRTPFPVVWIPVTCSLTLEYGLRNWKIASVLVVVLVAFYIFRPSVIFSVRWTQMWAGAGEEGPWLWRGLCSGPFVNPSGQTLLVQSSVFVRPPVSSTGTSPVSMNWLWANQPLSSDWMMMFSPSWVISVLGDICMDHEDICCNFFQVRFTWINNVLS